MPSQDRFNKRVKNIIAVFLDMAQVYDLCWREAALLKLNKMGVVGRTFHDFKSFLEDKKMAVRVRKTNIGNVHIGER